MHNKKIINFQFPYENKPSNRAKQVCGLLKKRMQLKLKLQQKTRVLNRSALLMLHRRSPIIKIPIQKDNVSIKQVVELNKDIITNSMLNIRKVSINI